MTTKYVSMDEVIRLFEWHRILSKWDLSIIENDFIWKLKLITFLEIDTLQRYDCDDIWDWPEMIKEDTGEFIRYDDLKKLLLQSDTESI